MPLLCKIQEGRFSCIEAKMIIVLCNMLKILMNQSDLGLCCLSMPFRQTTFRTSTVSSSIVIIIFHKKINTIF